MAKLKKYYIYDFLKIKKTHPKLSEAQPSFVETYTTESAELASAIEATETSLVAMFVG